MRLTCLGGAAAWPNPGQGCSSYLLRAGSATVVLDLGPDTLHELRRHADVVALDAIVISHLHADHMLDLVPLRYGLIYGPSDPPRPVPLWLPPGGSDMLRRVASAFAGAEDATSFWNTAFDVREYDPTAGLNLGAVRLRFTLTQHSLPCYAMRVTPATGAGLFYSADTGAIEPLIELARGADLALVEATAPGDEERAPNQRVHLTPRQAGELAQRAGARRLALTHLWSERPDADVIAQAAAAFKGEIVVAKPGLELDV